MIYIMLSKQPDLFHYKRTIELLNSLGNRLSEIRFKIDKSGNHINHLDEVSKTNMQMSR